MHHHFRQLLCGLVILGMALSARAEITLYAFQSSATAAVGALNARPEFEKYVLANSELPLKFAIPRFRKPLSISRIPKDAPVLRTSVAMVVDKTGTVVDAAAFNFNDRGFADAIVKAIPKMIAWAPNETKKKERALITLTFNTHSEDPEEYSHTPKP